jgi:hypothetical protein
MGIVHHKILKIMLLPHPQEILHHKIYFRISQAIALYAR